MYMYIHIVHVLKQSQPHGQFTAKGIVLYCSIHQDLLILLFASGSKYIHVTLSSGDEGLQTVMCLYKVVPSDGSCAIVHLPISLYYRVLSV